MLQNSTLLPRCMPLCLQARAPVTVAVQGLANMPATAQVMNDTLMEVCAAACYAICRIQIFKRLSVQAAASNTDNAPCDLQHFPHKSCMYSVIKC
jgi:hypothetical protein